MNRPVFLRYSAEKRQDMLDRQRTSAAEPTGPGAPVHPHQAIHP
jgi:hypothetical protein